MIYASAASRSTRRDGRMRKPPPAVLGDYLDISLVEPHSTLKQAREHTTSASITSMKEKVLDLHDLTAFPAFGKRAAAGRSRRESRRRRPKWRPGSQRRARPLSSIVVFVLLYRLRFNSRQPSVARIRM